MKVKDDSLWSLSDAEAAYEDAMSMCKPARTRKKLVAPMKKPKPVAQMMKKPAARTSIRKKLAAAPMKKPAASQMKKHIHKMSSCGLVNVADLTDLCDVRVVERDNRVWIGDQEVDTRYPCFGTRL